MNLPSNGRGRTTHPRSDSEFQSWQQNLGPSTPRSRFFQLSHTPLSSTLELPYEIRKFATGLLSLFPPNHNQPLGPPFFWGSNIMLFNPSESGFGSALCEMGRGQSKVTSPLQDLSFLFSDVKRLMEMTSKTLSCFKGNQRKLHFAVRRE